MRNRKIGLLCVAALLIAQIGFSAAMTTERNTKKSLGGAIYVGVYTNTRILAGSMVAINSSGYAVAASDTASITVIGCARSTVDNRTGATDAGNSGAKSITVDAGSFYWDLSTTTTNATLIGNIVYVSDDHTVSADATSSKIIAGFVDNYDSITKQASVATHNFAAAGSSTPSTLAVSGAATIGTTLAVGTTSTFTGVSTFKATPVFQNGITVNTNATVGGTLGVTGVMSLTAVPKTLAAPEAVGAITCVLTNGPTGVSSNALWMKISYGTTNAVIPVFVIP